MSISMKELFRRQGIHKEVISFRNSLANHPEGLKMGLREAYTRLRQPTADNALERGCRIPESAVAVDYIIGEKTVGEVLPAWVPVAGNTKLVRDHREGREGLRFDVDHLGETRILEGILTKSKITHTDFPFKPWHTYYDWNFYVSLDAQYKYLHSPSNIQDHDEKLECEWDSAYLPKWAWPQRGDRIWIVGRWIYDCGHPAVETVVDLEAPQQPPRAGAGQGVGVSGSSTRPRIPEVKKTFRYKTEIHPPKAVASFRSEAVQFDGNRGPTQANLAVLFIGRDGGYWRQPINDQDYSFDLYLPPKPYAEATPTWKIQPQTGTLPVQPQITPYPANAPRALRVTIPLKGVNPHPENYGAIISAGWSDPHGSEIAKIKKYRVTIEQLRYVDTIPPRFQSSGSPRSGMSVPHPPTSRAWHFYIGINGRWEIRKFSCLYGSSSFYPANNPVPLSYSVDLDLHPNDRIHITACGFIADDIHDLMGQSIGISWEDVCDPRQQEDNKDKIVDKFLSVWHELPGIENERISILSELVKSPSPLNSKVVTSSGKDYSLRYKVEAI